MVAAIACLAVSKQCLCTFHSFHEDFAIINPLDERELTQDGRVIENISGVAERVCGRSPNCFNHWVKLTDVQCTVVPGRHGLLLRSPWIVL